MNNVISRKVCPKCGVPMIYVNGELRCPLCLDKMFYGVCNDKCLEDQ